MQPLKLIDSFLKLESSSGLLLMLAAVLALLMANTGLASYYDVFIDIPVQVSIGNFVIAKPLLLWVNDGLMAIFFLLVGLELKRELIEGELSERRKIALPGLAAIGGMLVPALIYWAFNQHDTLAMQGWAIPTATDIAFALGVLVLVGSRVPASLKIFLTSLAIFDDLGAILIIAFFYTAQISLGALIVAAMCIMVLIILNRQGVEKIASYLAIGAIMWVALLKSGVHATLAGVILAMLIPMRSKQNPNYSPVCTLEHDLHPFVSFVILPVFAFCNAGINLSGLSLDQIIHPVPMGITLGLFVGKQLGVFTFAWLGIRLGIAKLPNGMNYWLLYGVAILSGIGFTMSLFIGSLAFEETGSNQLFNERLGILLGSFTSGLVGFLILKINLKAPSKECV